MSSATVYVLDTQTLVWFLKGNVHLLGPNRGSALKHPRARIVVPLYALEEMRTKFIRPKVNKDAIRIPPTPCLRLLLKCSNVRVLSTGPAMFAEASVFHELNGEQTEVTKQDVPIAAAALVVHRRHLGVTCLVTRDKSLRTWARRSGLQVL